MASKQSPLERLLGRLDQLDKVNLNILVQRLARERGLLETVLNTIQEGVLVIRDSGEIEYGNAAAARLLGMGNTELTGE
ncbi:MAG TPA: PAS domain-containing protein, partial [Opitutaceae bacterium]|nr:PAS domain-containing protein [Opitutaceae bacterium]